LELEHPNEDYLFMPQCEQVVAILRIFGLGTEKNTLQNNLVQIGTGGGKSLVLAIASSLFALLGFDVTCACYSQYLSERDYNAFLPLFEQLNLTHDIHYGTFNFLCERVINENNKDLRKRVSNLISGKGNQENERKKKIMIIPKSQKFCLLMKLMFFSAKNFMDDYIHLLQVSMIIRLMI